MGGKSTSTQQQQSTTEPWKPTQATLGNVINQLQSASNPSTIAPTSAELGAINSLQANAQNLPDYTPQATGLLNNLFSGGTDRTGIVSDAYSQYQKALTPYTQAADPTQAPGMQNVLDTINNDVRNSVSGLFAGAGRDLSGAHVNNLSRGLSSGLAAPLLNQYNTNAERALAASGNLFNAGGATAGLLSGLDQTALGNQLAGLTTAPSINQANAGANATLQAGQLERGLPLSNLGQILNLILPIAGLGGQSQGTGTTTNQMSGAQQFATIMSGIGNLIPKGPLSFKF